MNRQSDSFTRASMRQSYVRGQHTMREPCRACSALFASRGRCARRAGDPLRDHAPCRQVLSASQTRPQMLRPPGSAIAPRDDLHCQCGRVDTFDAVRVHFQGRDFTPSYTGRSTTESSSRHAPYCLHVSCETSHAPCSIPRSRSSATSASHPARTSATSLVHRTA